GLEAGRSWVRNALRIGKRLVRDCRCPSEWPACARHGSSLREARSFFAESRRGAHAGSTRRPRCFVAQSRVLPRGQANQSLEVPREMALIDEAEVRRYVRGGFSVAQRLLREPESNPKLIRVGWQTEATLEGAERLKAAQPGFSREGREVDVRRGIFVEALEHPFRRAGVPVEPRRRSPGPIEGLARDPRHELD